MLLLKAYTFRRVKNPFSLKPKPVHVLSSLFWKKRVEKKCTPWTLQMELMQYSEPCHLPSFNSGRCCNFLLDLANCAVGLLWSDQTVAAIGWLRRNHSVTVRKIRDIKDLARFMAFCLQISLSIDCAWCTVNMTNIFTPFYSLTGWSVNRLETNSSSFNLVVVVCFVFAVRKRSYWSENNNTPH